MTKNNTSFGFWFKQFAPPSLLLFLIWFPIDIVTIIFWIIGFLICFMAFILLVIRLIKFAMLKQEQKEKRKAACIGFIRPGMTVIMFLIAFMFVNLLRISADNYAKVTGKKIQDSCNAKRQCPPTIVGWENASEGMWYSSVVFYGWGAKYRITYTVSKDKKEFYITVKHNIDEGFDVSGGVEESLEFHKFGPR